MRKRKRSLRPINHTYSEQQLAGLHAHAQTQKQSTVNRLRTAITALQAQHKPISARTIYEACGLEYASIRRNPEALQLYQQHSTFLQAKRKRLKAPKPDTPIPHDPLLAYTKPQLAAQVREERRRRQEVEAQHTPLLEELVQKDVKIAELEAKLASYESYLGRLRQHMQQQEQQV